MDRATDRDRYNEPSRAVARLLKISWNTVNTIALDLCRKITIDNPAHMAGVRKIGVDEHVWKHTFKPGQPSKYVTVIVDLTPGDTGRPARLLDMVPGRSAEVLNQWLQARGEQLS
ncbi:transposase [Corynebacterium choanae]|uniref:Transposase n=1 Tax=Corynebacterium choanae TaxID=1862358 RepID=A0A3G6JB95_9CORY|nr:Transposase [Corynebacterium choanae]